MNKNPPTESIFFSPLHYILHEQVLSHLASDPTIHTSLPLLRVSHYWRKLTVEKLIVEFAHTTIKGDQWLEVGQHFEPDLGPGGFVKVSARSAHLTVAQVVASSYCPRQGPTPKDDPRFYFTAEGRLRDTTIFTLDHVDPKTLLCTFKPVEEELMIITYDHPCDSKRRPCSDVDFSFAVVSSAWFRPASGKQWGFELAAAPNRCPSCSAEIWAEISKDLDSCVEVYDASIGWKDWTATWYTSRDDFAFDPRDTSIECMLVVLEIRLPLLDLFRPPETLSEEGYHE